MRLIQTVKLGLSVLILMSSTHAFAKSDAEKAVEAKAQADSKGALCENLLVKVDPDKFGSFEGGTEIGHERLKNAISSFIKTTDRGNKNFEGMRGYFELDFLGMAARHNVDHDGGPGAAKTGHLDWLLPPNKTWKKQMNEMMNSSAIFGLPTLASIEAGKPERNRNGSATEYEFVILDEKSNLNPAAAGDTLSFMNPGERTHEGHKAKTRTVFSTSNATNGQTLAKFKEERSQSGPALMNRTVLKSWYTNWLTHDQQGRRDKHIEWVEFQKYAAMYADTPEKKQKALAHLKGLQAEDIDWEAIEAFARLAFIAHEDLWSAAREFANEFRKEVRALEQASNEAHIKDPINNPYVYVPNVDWTERLRTEVIPLIKISAALDYFRMVGPEGLDIKKFNKPIVLTPMSLWRIMYLSTKTGPGENRFNPFSMQIDFNLMLNNKPELVNWEHQIALDGCKDKTEKDELGYMWKEQQATNRLLLKINKDLANSAKELAPWMPQSEDQMLGFDESSQDFEIVLANKLHQLRPLSKDLRKVYGQEPAAQPAAPAAPAK